MSSFSSPRGGVVVRATVAAAVVLASVLPGRAAEAYALQETGSGLPVRWDADTVALELDPSVIAAFPDALDMAVEATGAWPRVESGPSFAISLAATASSPGVDGRNVIYFAKDGFPQAGDALAITLVSYDSHTGAIVDADIVINGLYDFAVLPSGARAAAGAIAITNEPPAGTDVGPANPFGLAVGATNDGTAVFDLLHVLAHESGHVLGLRDSEDDASDVMYPYTFPGDASRRAPSSDDLAGIESLYEAAPAVAGGCTLSSVALPSTSGRPRTGAPSWPAVVGVAACWAMLLARRRRASSAPFSVET